MTKDNEKKVLADLADSMHKVSEGLETMAIYLLRDVTEAVQKQPKTEPAVPQVTLEELRAVLAAKSAEGHTAEVRELLHSFGADKLSAVKPEDYAAIKAKAEVL